MKTRPYVMAARADAVESTRSRILHGARRLFSEQWYDDVTLAAIAAEAAVSHQTVLNHFGSKEGVLAAVSDAIEAEFDELESQPAPGDTTAAVRILLDRYEDFGLTNAHFVVQEHRSPPLHQALERGRSQHRRWVERTFDHCLAPSGPRRRQKIAALLAATEVMAWKAVRHDYGFSKTDTAAAITALVKSIEEEL